MKRLKADGRDTVYLDKGAGPPLLCIHGSFSDCRVWMPVLDRLSQKFRVIAPSMRSFWPESWKPGDEYTIDRHVQDIAAFIDTLGLGRVNLMGHSRGGHLAFRVTQKYEGSVRKLILLEPGGSFQEDNPAPHQQPSELLTLTSEVGALVQSGRIDDGLKLFVDSIDGAGEWDAVGEEIRQQIRDNASTLLAQPKEGRMPFLTREAQGIQAPTLIVIGEETPGFLPTVSRRLAQHIPNCSTATIPGGRHHMFRQQPEPFTDAVIGFLESNGEV